MFTYYWMKKIVKIRGMKVQWCDAFLNFGAFILHFQGFRIPLEPLLWHKLDPFFNSACVCNCKNSFKRNMVHSNWNQQFRSKKTNETINEECCKLLKWQQVVLLLVLSLSQAGVG